MKLLIVIGGPTAVGKTTTSIAVAKYFKTEIISADSRQFYKEMNIGTAKPTLSQLAAVPHHFISHLHVWQEYNAGDFERDALAQLDQLFKEKDVVIITGGSGMYIDAVCYGFDAMPDIPEEIRDNLMEMYDSKGIEWLQEQLKLKDPEYFKQVDVQNPQRLMRALEVVMATGNPYSYYRKKEPKPRPFKILNIGLESSREILYERINQRVDIMIEDGLIEEAKALKNYRQHNALQTVGYQELFEYLEGKISLSEAIELIKRNTRRYAKRQLTWFRRNEDMSWYPPNDITGIIYKISLALNKPN